MIPDETPGSRRDQLILYERMFDQIGQVVPSSLEEIPAGPELAAALADVDVDGLAASDRIDSRSDSVDRR